jgi:hypothetical protein
VKKKEFTVAGDKRTRRLIAAVFIMLGVFAGGAVSASAQTVDDQSKREDLYMTTKSTKLFCAFCG